MKEADEILQEAAQTFAERKVIYGTNYINAGNALHALFPNGVTLSNEIDQRRFHIFTWIIGKLSRYALNFDKGGHQDSIHDACVYAAMLEAIDEEAQMLREYDDLLKEK